MSDRIVLLPALKWVSKSAPTGGGYLVCCVTPGRDWWDLDDAVEAIPGHRPMTDARSNRRYHAIPVERLADLEVIAESYPNRLRVHVTK